METAYAKIKDAARLELSMGHTLIMIKRTGCSGINHGQPVLFVSDFHLIYAARLSDDGGILTRGVAQIQNNGESAHRS